MLSSGLVFSQTKMTKLLTSVVCGQGLTQKYICEKGLLFLVAGSDPYLFDTVITAFYEFIQIEKNKKKKNAITVTVVA